MMKFVLLFALIAVLAAPSAQAIDGEIGTEAKPIGRCPPRDIPNKPPRFLPDANDCRLYYECSGGQMTQRVCPEGTCFTRKDKGCV